MKIVLINANPAVSRLATLALSKMGYEYVQLDDASELADFFDVLIIDSDIDVKNINLKEFANKILYLSSKNSPIFEGADRMLPKPFLPTEFITIVEDLISKTKSARPAVNVEETAEVSVEGFEFMDDPTQDILKDEMMEADEDEFKLDDEFDELLRDERSKEGTFDELNEIAKAIDDMDEFDSETQENLGEQADAADNVEIAVKEEKFGEIEDVFDDLKTDATLENADAADELSDIKFDLADEDEEVAAQDKFELDFDGSIEDIKHQIDEIDSMNEYIKEESIGVEVEGVELEEIKFEIPSEPGDVKFNADEPEFDADVFTIEESADESEIAQNLAQAQDNDKFLIEEANEQEDIFADDEIKFDEPIAQNGEDALGEADFDKFDIASEIAQNEPSEENLAQDIFDDGGDDIFAQDQAQETEREVAENEPETAQEIDVSEYGDIEQISEKDMALALNESGFETGETANPSKSQASKIDELKAQISDAVAKNLQTSLQDGELREALKNLNIKINISFEEK